MQSVARNKIKTAKRKLDDSSSSLSAEMWSKKRAAVIPNKIKTKYYVSPLKKSHANKDKLFLNEFFYKSLHNDHNYLKSKNCIFFYNINQISNNPARPKIKGCTIPRTSLNTLKGDHWINGDVVNEYFKLISHQGKYKTYVVDSFVFERFSEKQDRKYKHKKNLLNFDLVFFPINVNSNHWAFILLSVENFFFHIMIVCMLVITMP